MASLQNVHEDDIVEVDVRGRRAFGIVLHKLADRRGLKIKPIYPPTFTWTEVTSNQVIGHYRKTKNRPRIRTSDTEST